MRLSTENLIAKSNDEISEVEKSRLISLIQRMKKHLTELEEYIQKPNQR